MRVNSVCDGINLLDRNANETTAMRDDGSADDGLL